MPSSAMFLNYFDVAIYVMTIRTARGCVKSVKIFDVNRKGEIRLRTSVNPDVDITLKLSNNNDTTFCAMTTVVAAAVKFGDAAVPGQAPNLHVKYDDNNMEIDEMEFHWH
jgi:hypothetical protein